MTAVQLLPIQEFQPHSAWATTGPTTFLRRWISRSRMRISGPMLARVNALLDAKGLKRYDSSGPARGNESAQGADRSLPCLRTCGHLRRGLQPRGRRFRRSEHVLFRSPAGLGRQQKSLYFTDRGHAGGLVFDYGKPEVRDFLIQNAKFFLDEYRVDGFRYDQVSVIDHDGAPHGWSFCQDLTDTLHVSPPAVR